MAATGIGPSWLDACHVQKVLRNAEKDESIEVSNIIVKPATVKGDNYASDMHRVTLKTSRVKNGEKIQEHRSLIVKAAPQGDMREEPIEASGFFETELSMVSVTLPRMFEILKKVYPTSLGARCLYVQYEKPTHVIIEDLAPKGFRMADRQAGMDLDHCLLALRNLGRFHAASIALKEKDHDAFTKYNRGMLHKDLPSVMSEFFNAGVKAIADETVNWSELNPRITEKLRKLSDTFFEKGCETNLYREDDFNVLNHGDFWVNNMLFRYDEQRKPTHHIFVDFQLSHYGSPAFDIFYFLGTSPKNEIRLHEREILLREYHSSLTEAVVKLRCTTEVPTFEKLQELLKRRRFYEVFASMSILPVVLLEKGEEIDMNEIIKLGNEYKNPSFRGKSYRNAMTELLPWYDSMGLLDV